MAVPRSSRPLLGLAAIFAFLTLLAPFASAAERMDAPVWAPGDEWDFYVRGEGQGPNGPEPFAYIGKMMVIGQETLDDQGKQIATLKVVELHHNLATPELPSTWGGNGVDYRGGGIVSWVDPVSGVVYRRIHLREHEGVMSSPEGLRVFPGGCDMQGYPLVPGVLREPPCTEERTVNGNGETVHWTAYAKTLAVENVTGPAGTFQAFAVDMGGNGQAGERQWYVPEACWRVKTEGVPGNPISMQLLGYRCGDRSGGNLSTVSPPIDFTLLAPPGGEAARSPMVESGLLLAAVVALALVARRR